MGSHNKTLRFLWLPLIFSCSLMAQPSEELISRAEENQIDAQIELATQYQTEGKFKRAHYWAAKAAVNGDSSAAALLASLYESKQEQFLNPLTVSENWYQIATEQGDSQAEQGYARVLEALFNQQRARQVSSIASLDKQIDEDLAQSENIPPAQNTDTESHKLFRLDAVITATLLTMVVAFVALRRSRRSKKQSQTDALQQTISQQKKKIKSLQLHINKAHQQLKQNQQVKQINTADNNLSLACALLGFKANDIPGEKAIKARYKMLSRVYHPDANGSEEEMKRLNAAVKLVVTHLKKTSKN